MKKLGIAVVLGMVAVGLALGGTAGAEPSDGCDSGAVPPATTPLGIGILQTGDPTTSAILRLCNNGAVVPAPLKGALTLGGSATGTSGFVSIDGDSDNDDPAPCTDGFVAVAVDAAGPHFRGEPDGDATSPSPEKPLEAFIADLVEECAGPLPAPPSLP